MGIVLLDIVLGPCIILHCFRIFAFYVVVDRTRSQPFNRSLHLILWVTISELTVARSTALRPIYVILDPPQCISKTSIHSRLQYLQLLPLDQGGNSVVPFMLSIIANLVDVLHG